MAIRRLFTIDISTFWILLLTTNIRLISQVHLSLTFMYVGRQRCLYWIMSGYDDDEHEGRTNSKLSNALPRSSKTAGRSISNCKKALFCLNVGGDDSWNEIIRWKESFVWKILCPIIRKQIKWCNRWKWWNQNEFLSNDVDQGTISKLTYFRL